MSYPGKPTIFNLTLTSGSTEYSQALPEITSKVMIKARSTSHVLQLAYVSGTSGTVYLTIPAGQTYWDDSIGSSATLYLQSPSAGAIAEILCWSGS
jgi:hypothetical protein